MNKFDEMIAGSIDICKSYALKEKNIALGVFHLLYGLINNPYTQSSKLLKKHKGEVVNFLSKEPKTSIPVQADQISTTLQLSEWITHASSNAIENGRREVSEQDLLKFLPRMVPQISFDPSIANIGDNKKTVDMPQFLTNLNELAEEGSLDPVIGRQSEIRAVMEILGRRRKNNPMLVGEPGVGKTAIIEGLAEAIEKEKVPNILKDKIIYSLDLGSLLSGTSLRGSFEEKIKELLKFSKSKKGKCIIFIDEIHQLVGVGKTDGAMDGANLLKPALSRGDIYCIGATTENEYQKYILKDVALSRRFREVRVKEPSNEEAIEIIMGIRDKFESHHGIKISNEAVYASVLLSAQYMTDKYLPDKAIDLVDEACSSMKINAEAPPPKLVDLEKEIRAKLIQAKIEKDDNSILEEVKLLREKVKIEKDKWDRDLLSIKRVSELKNELDLLKFNLEKSERENDFEEASKIKFVQIPGVEAKLNNFRHVWVLEKKNIAEVISRHTFIPVEKILKKEQKTILNLESYLNSRVFGQQKALYDISCTLKISYAGLSKENKPLGSFLLLGPSGVGKTETAKALCNFLFNSEKNLIRFDLSEFSDQTSVSKLIGASPGYVGYEEGGVLTEAIRKNSYAVLLFDEIEKAHSNFSDILLQILDEGRLTDNKGRTIDFKNTVIFMTSNAKDYKREFKPELLGRIDSILQYESLDKNVMGKLVDKQVALLNARLKDRKLVAALSDNLKKHLEETGYNETYGARPLESLFNKIVIKPLADRVLSGNLEKGTLTADLVNEEVVFS